MKVLLISTNRCRNMAPPFPLGLAFLLASLDTRRHEVQVWDAMFAEDWNASLRERLRAFQPEVVGLSIRNVDDQDMRSPFVFLDEAREMAVVCREETRAILVGGGAGYGMYPEAILSLLGLDFGVVGDGERVFPRLLDRLQDGLSPAGMAGLVWREENRVISAPPDWSQPLSDLPQPDRSLLNAPGYYVSRGSADIPNTITLQSKRGCPLTCSYCSTFAIEGRSVRVRSPQDVVEEVARLEAQGFERLQFVDSVFTNPPSHARALCEEMIRRGTKAHWSATISPDYAEPDLLRLMKQAGCAMAMVGNESGSARTLRSLGKRFEPEDVARCFDACKQAGLPYYAFLLLGAPGEDRESVRESVDLMQRFEPAHVNVSVGIRLYPGCELTRRAQEEGMLGPEDDMLTPRFYLAPAVRDWIWDYIGPIMAQDPRWTF